MIDRWKAGAMLVTALALCSVFGWQQMRIGQLRSAAAEQARQTERDALAREGALLAAEEDQHAAERLVTDLREQIAAARRVAPSAAVTQSASVRTGPLTAHAVVSNAEARPDSNPLGLTPAPGPSDSTPPGSDGPSSSRCLLREGDAGELGAEWAGLETKAGNRVLVGRLWANRLGPPVETVLEGPIRTDVSRWIVAPPMFPVRRATWAASVEYGVAGGRAWAIGAERRVAGPVWLGLAAGADGGTARVAARLRVEW